ncbi:MAG: hypothetical protein PHQ47_03165 [Candidatus Portnoybacteria bacterium]|nr:hypothetical protein [Candidatus Portnoybacteria bacterium]
MSKFQIPFFKKQTRIRAKEISESEFEERQNSLLPFFGCLT